MRIAQLCLSTGCGGLELYMCHTLQRLLDNNIETIAIVRENSFISEQLQKHQLVSFKSPRLKELPIISAWRLAKILDQQKIDILHIHHNYDLPLASLAKRFTKRPLKLVVHRHMNMPGSKRDRYHRFIYSQIDLVLCITKKMQNDYINLTGIDNDKIKLLYLGTSVPDSIEKSYLKENTQWQDNDFSIGLFGRISEGKGQDDLIDAIKLLRDEHNTNVNAAIIGKEHNAEYAKKIKQQCSNANLQDQIVFLPFHPKPQAIMPAFDVIAVPSTNETFGLVNIEAMRVGKPVIAAYSDGIAEIIEHEKTGLICRPKDSADLAKSILQLYQDRNLLSTLAGQGKTFADKTFDKENHYQRLINILHSL